MAPSIKLHPKDQKLAQETRRTNRLNSIKNELEAGRISNFDQIFAIMSETRLSIELGISFYAFRKKVVDPGEFTFNEAEQMAALFGIKKELMTAWLNERMNQRPKSRMSRK